MIVIRRKLQDKQKPEIIYAISKDGAGVYFSFSGKVRGYDINESVSIPFSKYKGKILNMSLQWTHKCEIHISPLYEMTSRYYVSAEQNNEAYILCRVSISDDCNDIVVFLQRATDYKCPDAQNTYIPAGMTKAQIMMQCSPYYKNRAEHFNKKCDVMKSVDIYNTVTYLESQVDALTRLILQLTNSNSEAAKILRKADKYSVLDIKDEDKILQELETDKKNVRDMQKEYYDKD